MLVRPAHFMPTVVIMAWKIEVCLLLDDNYDSVFMRAIKPSARRSCVWRWLLDASHQPADMCETRLPDKPSPLAEPFKSSSPWPAFAVAHMIYHLFELQRTYAVTASLAASRSRPMLLFPVIKLSCPCRCVKSHLNCQLGLGDVSLGPFLSYLFFQRCGRLNFSWLQSVWSSLLDWRFWQSLWFCCPSKCRSAKAQLSTFIQAV